MSADELRAIFAALADEPAAMQSYVRLLFLTGARGGELLRLRWQDVTFEPEAWLTFPADITKSKREHRVPLSGPAVIVLRDLREQAGTSSWLFPSAQSANGRRSSAQDFYRRIGDRSGVSWVGHDGRRWCATILAANGVPLEVVGRILGHADPSVTARHYAKASYASEMRRALELLARKLDQVVTDEAPAKVVSLRA